MRVIVLCPLPPSRGGITEWAKILKTNYKNIPSLKLKFINTFPRFKSYSDFLYIKRISAGLIEAPKTLYQLLKGILFFKPHLIHLTTSAKFGLLRDIVVIIFCKILSVRVIYHLHFGRVPSIYKNINFESIFLTISLNLSDKVIVLDKLSESVLLKFFRFNKIHFIPNGIKIPAQIDDSYHTSNDIVFIGNVIKDKGIEELLSSWCLLDNCDYKLLIVGRVNRLYKKYLLKRYPSNNIKFLGLIPHEKALGILRKSKIFILPSHTEAFPYSILEAMSFGKAIIATDVGAIPYMIGSNSGVIIPPKDIKVLANSIKLLLENPNLINDLEINSFKRVKNKFDIQVVLQQYFSLWSETIKIKDKNLINLK